MESAITDLDGFNKLVRGRDAFYLANENDTYVGQSLVQYGEYNQEEYDLISRLVQPGSFIAEVGANTGPHTVRLAKTVGLGGRVIAYEPQPVVFQSLAGTIALNSLMNVDCLPYALGAEEGEIIFPPIDYRKPNNFGGLSLIGLTGSGTPVRVAKLDDVYSYPRLDFLKIDVEGMELDVLKGGRSSIERFKPLIYVENDQLQKSAELIRWLLNADYRLWRHLPALFNSENFFGNKTNLFGNTRNVNMLAVPKGRPVDIALREVKDETEFPES